MVREAVSSARLLVKLSRKRKGEDMKFLNDGMRSMSGPWGHLGDKSSQGLADDINLETSDVENMPIAEANTTLEAQSSSVSGIVTPGNIGWIDGLEPQLPENYAIDWNSFLNTLDWL
jgi:hypothetical protein